MSQNSGHVSKPNPGWNIAQKFANGINCTYYKIRFHACLDMSYSI